MAEPAYEPPYSVEVERRLERPFEEVKDDLVELFDMSWEEIEVVIETSAAKKDRSRADVVVDLVDRAQAKPTFGVRIRRSVVRWIGKPWRERTNPWDRYKHRIPDAPPPTDTPSEDLEEWAPLRADDEEQ